jgi:hypothetical protein
VQRAFAAALSATTLLACGSRTPLDVTSSGDVVAEGDAAVVDAASSPDDATTPVDGSTSCNDGGGPSELAYALDDVGALYRYEPSTNRATRLGVPDCGNSNVQWTMTATRDTAYVVYTDWTLYTIDLATLSCRRTSFQSGQLGIEDQFGVAAVGEGTSTHIYVYGLPTGAPAPMLAVMDTRSYVLKPIATVHPAPPSSSYPVNLTADGAGRLYAYSPEGLVQVIDPATGAVVRSKQTTITTSSTWATIAYADALFLWAGPRVVGYDLTTQTTTTVRDAGIFAIGASSYLSCAGM